MKLPLPDREWLVIESYSGHVVTSYDDRDEAEAAAEWYVATYGGPTLEVCHRD